MTLVHLRREFENPSPALKTVASRLSRGTYKRSERSSEPSVRDDRGRLVRAVGKTQTFLSTAQVDQLVALYGEGLSVAELGRRFGIDSRTAAAHLVRRSIPLGQRGLAMADVPESIELYESGLTLAEVGLRFNVSDKAVRSAVAAGGVTIRPRGRRRYDVTGKKRPDARGAGWYAPRLARCICTHHGAGFLMRGETIAGS